MRVIIHVVIVILRVVLVMDAGVIVIVVDADVIVVVEDNSVIVVVEDDSVIVVVVPTTLSSQRMRVRPQKSRT